MKILFTLIEQFNFGCGYHKFMSLRFLPISVRVEFLWKVQKLNSEEDFDGKCSKLIVFVEFYDANLIIHRGSLFGGERMLIEFVLWFFVLCDEV
jgi:hypothetical protein